MAWDSLFPRWDDLIIIYLLPRIRYETPNQRSRTYRAVLAKSQPEVRKQNTITEVTVSSECISKSVRYFLSDSESEHWSQSENVKSKRIRESVSRKETIFIKKNFSFYLGNIFGLSHNQRESE